MAFSGVTSVKFTAAPRGDKKDTDQERESQKEMKNDGRSLASVPVRL